MIQLWSTVPLAQNTVFLFYSFVEKLELEPETCNLQRFATFSFRFSLHNSSCAKAEKHELGSRFGGSLIYTKSVFIFVIFLYFHNPNILGKGRKLAAHLGGSYTHNLFSLRDKTREKKMENSLFYLTEQSGREILLHQGMEENTFEIIILPGLAS